MTVSQTHVYESSHDTYSQVSAAAKASYGGLFYSGSVSGGFTKKSGNTSLTQSGSKLEISFKVRKVVINRPWVEEELLHYPTIGIKGLGEGSWSSGELDDKTNKGSFPILPTAFVVAKDVKITADSYSKTAEATFKSLKSHASAKVCL